MAKESMKARELKRQKLVEKYAEKRAALKAAGDYEGLQKLYEKYGEQGFEVLGFPCNQFGEQEKGSESEIKGFCEAKYSISFPMFSKVDVNGDNASPVFEFLKKQAKGFLGTESVKWNFSKFLVSRDGKTVKRYGSLDAPEILNNDIEAVL